MIVKYPNKVLLEKTQPVDFSRDEVKRLSDDMFVALEEVKGVGLAANQFSDLTPLSMFVLDLKEKDELFSGVFINPEMVGHSNETATAPEMCLSFPGVSVNKERHQSLTLRWVDLEQKEHEEAFTGFRAVVLQHEMDHLCGKTIISSLSSLKQKLVVDKMRKNMVKSERVERKAKHEKQEENHQH